MTKKIITRVDEKGEVSTELSGFTEEESIEEEIHLRKALEACGMALHVRIQQCNAEAANVPVPIRHKIR
ncbi:MAG: hypothetical protein GX130_07445 [Candidatus Hydrogenedens sp.]|jgi:hypothetical protein|nr:hypothetical protein [Candidatus Hydrogenedens sp.]